MLLFLHAIGSSNILEIYMIFCINKEMKRSTERVKTMIGDQAYINRKRYKILLFFSLKLLKRVKKWPKWSHVNYGFLGTTGLNASSELMLIMDVV